MEGLPHRRMVDNSASLADDSGRVQQAVVKGVVMRVYGIAVLGLLGCGVVWYNWGR